MKYAAVLLLCLTVITSTANAQNPWAFKQIDNRSGLSNSAINCIHQDSYGYVWFGTWDGLNRYDGDHIEVYKPIADNPHSINNNIIKEILEDQKGNLWFVTYNGINRYSYEEDRFYRYFHDLPNIPFVENSLRAYLSNDSILHVSRIGWGIATYDYEKDNFTPILNESSFRDIYEIGHTNGLTYLLNQSGQLLGLDNQGVIVSQRKTGWTKSSHWLYKIVDIQDHLYFVYQTTAHEIRLVGLNNQTDQPEQVFKIEGSRISSISKNPSSTTVFLGTIEGHIYELSENNNKVTLSTYNLSLPNLIEDRLKVFSVFRTTNDQLWVGTDGNGVYQYATLSRPFHSIGDEEESSLGPLPNRVVRSITKDENDNLLIGTLTGGLNIWHPTDSTLSIIDDKTGLSANAVLSMAQDQSKNLWLGLDSEGIDMIEKGSGKVFHFPRDFSNAVDALQFGSVYRIFVDAYGDLWLGTSGYGVIHLIIEKRQNRYLLKDYEIINTSFPSKNGIKLRSNIIYAIEGEEPNILWFGSRYGGLYRYNAITKTFTHHLHENGPKQRSLTNSDILSLHLDKPNFLWVGTSGGLNKVNLYNYTVNTYNEINGLANNTIHGLLKDKEGKLWASTNKGLYVYAEEQNNFQNITWTDGLLNQEFTDGAYFEGQDGKLYFGGTRGVDIIEPDKVITSTEFPRIALTDLYIVNQKIQPRDSTRILSKNIDIQSAITLAYDQNHLTIDFTALDFKSKDHIKYRYYLEGADNNWIDIRNQNSINLTNIPHGHYTLHINNSNEFGDWNPKSKRLNIIITPPWWASRLAYATYIFLGILLQIGIILGIRKRNKLKKHREIEALKTQQQEEIQRYKLEFFTNIAHEFRTPLTLIIGPALQLIKSISPTSTQHEQVKGIYQNSLRLQKLIQELLQFRKIEIGKEKPSIAPIDLQVMVEEIKQSFVEHAKQKGIEISLTYPEETIVQYADRSMLEKILINLISNAIKYNKKGGIVEVKIWSAAEKTFIKVKDDGIGIDAANIQLVFDRFSVFSDDSTKEGDKPYRSAGLGLALSKKLIELHGGDLTVDSAPDIGSEFIFWLPNKEESEKIEIPTVSSASTYPNISRQVNTELLIDEESKIVPLPISLTPHDDNILIVDDNPQILLLLKEMLATNYQVFAANRVAEALEILKDQKIDLIISDVMMPDTDGIEFCKTIKSNLETSHIPVILLTAKGEIEEKIIGIASGADSYIPKPFHPQHLLTRVTKLIESRASLKRRFSSDPSSEIEKSIPTLGDPDNDFFKKLNTLIKKEIKNTALDAEWLAMEMALSKTTLYKKIKAITGYTPHGLINAFRLQKAADLLENSNLTVSEIVYAVGFNSRSYFYKSFQEKYDMSPSSYIKRKNQV